MNAHLATFDAVDGNVKCSKRICGKIIIIHFQEVQSVALFSLFAFAFAFGYSALNMRLK